MMQQKGWGILFGAVLLAMCVLVAVSPAMGWWLPDNVCTFGHGTDNLFHLILFITGFFFLFTEGLLVYSMIRFAGPGRKASFFHGSHKLELIWTVVPAAILLFIAFTQVKAWADIKYQSRMPVPNQILEVSARQFEWRLRYPVDGQLGSMIGDGEKGVPDDWRKRGEVWAAAPQTDDVRAVNEIHTWKDARVRVYLKTRDVIHSFFLPNMRIKQDALPGKTIPVWFQSEAANCHFDETSKGWVIDSDKEWELACAELCGWGHYKMRGMLYVHPDKADYDKWLTQAKAEQDRKQP
jgi:cytochrome c oxidase subunit 2